MPLVSNIYSTWVINLQFHFSLRLWSKKEVYNIIRSHYIILKITLVTAKDKYILVGAVKELLRVLMLWTFVCI